jgi:Holliday junction resolvase RusA-like endonuclease
MRHRTTNKGQTYNPAQNVKYRKLVQTCIRVQNTARKWNLIEPYFKGPLLLEIHAIYPYPKSAKITKSVWWRSKRPDLSNIIKGVEDSLNTVAYEDDAQIALITASKEEAVIDEPRTLIIIEELF